MEAERKKRANILESEGECGRRREGRNMMRPHIRNQRVGSEQSGGIETEQDSGIGGGQN